MAKAKGSINVVMVIEKETKNTFRYQEVTKKEFDRTMIGTLYLPKDISKGAEKIKVSVELC